MMARERELAATLVDLADTLVSDYDLVEYLDKLLTVSTALLGSSGGGVLLRSTEQESPLELLGWTGERMDVVELFQLQRQEGPCLDAVVGRERVLEADLATSTRWPSFAEIAVREDYRSVAAFPMLLRGEVLGALNIFWEDPGHAEPEDILAVQAFADMATIGILQERSLREARDLTAHLQTALISRVVIEQAKGVLAEQADVDMPEAFQLLRLYSRNSNRKIRDVATAVVEGDLSAASIALQGRRRRS